MVIFGLLYLALADKIFPAFSWSGNTGKDLHMPVGKILVGIQVMSLSTESLAHVLINYLRSALWPCQQL